MEVVTRACTRGGVALLAVVLVAACIRSVLRPGAHGILRTLALLFVPAAVGVVQYGPLLAEHGIALVVILVVSTALAMAVTALVFRLVGGRVGGGER